jgi:hypothetical protein
MKHAIMTLHNLMRLELGPMPGIAQVGLKSTPALSCYYVADTLL